MGNQPPKRPPPQRSLEDHIIDMKMNAKQIQRAAKNSQKEQKKYIKQAKDALKKNNEDFAKLYATSASQKHNEAVNYKRTAVKMQLMCDQIKSMNNNQKMMNTFGQLSNAVSMQMGQVDTTKMAENLQMFNNKMDQALINNKMMTQLMSSNDMADTNVDGMLDALKGEIAMEEKNKMEINVSENTYKLPNQQQQQQQQYAPQSQNQGMGGQKVQDDGDDHFLNQLKGL